MIKRNCAKSLKELSKMFSCVMVTGARQVGKTTLLQTFGKGHDYVTFDNPIYVREVTENGENFLKSYKLPLILDEVQYVPDLFHYVKMMSDSLKKKGIFFMSGSQQFKMMKNVSESLTGRVGILNLSTLSLRELNEDSFDLQFLPNDKYLSNRFKKSKRKNISNIWNVIQRGTLPELVVNKNFDFEKYYTTYVNTYIERDVRDLTQVGDKALFTKFMSSVAARSGQMLNKSDIAKDIGVSEPTIDRWISILETSNIIYLLNPYSNNHLKRAIKTPKLYFLDTGLCAYLTRWSTSKTLEFGAEAGHFFETYIVSEIIKSYYNSGIIDPPIYYYRDKDQNEIDLIIEKDGILYPLEIKKYTNYDKHDINTFKILEKIPNTNIGNGGIICMYDRLLKISENRYVIPYDYI